MSAERDVLRTAGLFGSEEADACADYVLRACTRAWNWEQKFFFGSFGGTHLEGGFMLLVRGGFLDVAPEATPVWWSPNRKFYDAIRSRIDGRFPPEPAWWASGDAETLEQRVARAEGILRRERHHEAGCSNRPCDCWLSRSPPPTP